jgi:hypothetical protein
VKNSASFKMMAVPHFALLVRARLDNYFTCRWIGRRGQQHDLCDVPILLHTIYFCGTVPKRK